MIINHKTLIEHRWWLTVSISILLLFLYMLIAPDHYFKNKFPLLNYIYFIDAILMYFLYFLFLKHLRKSPVFNFRYLQKINLKTSVKVLLIFSLYFIQQFLSLLFYNGKSGNQKKLDRDDLSFINSVLNGGFKAPIIEEIIFRGMLFIIIVLATSLVFKMENKITLTLMMCLFIALSAIIFGVAHVINEGDYQHIGPYISSGFIYSLALTLTRDIKIPIALHMLNNIPLILNKFGYSSITITMFIIFLVIFILSFIKFYKTLESNPPFSKNIFLKNKNF